MRDLVAVECFYVCSTLASLIIVGTQLPAWFQPRVRQLTNPRPQPSSPGLKAASLGFRHSMAKFELFIVGRAEEPQIYTV